MEYERIHKIQTGIISPSKLRMKLIGPHHQRKKDGSNSNSSRTSPSRLADSEFVKSGLLNPEIEDFYDQVPGFDLSSVRLPADKAPMENGEPGPSNTMHQLTKTDSCNLSTVHPLRNLDDDNNLDYDSNASSSSFEFHKAERSLHGSMARSISRPIPSKWNNAEKWIMSRNAAQANCSKKTGGPGSGGRFPVTNVVRVAPDSGSFDHRAPVNRVADTKRVDFCQPASQMGMEKFSFVPPSMHPSLCQANGETALANLCPQTKELKEGVHGDMLCTKPMTEGSTSMSEDSKALPAIRSVAMRDMGTEMTPIPSQEPSRTSTPVGATTPLRSPSSSLPSTPRRGAPASTRMMDLTENGKRELSEQELKEKTRKEIVALGVQLGKMNIAAWASKDEQEKRTSLGSSNFDEIGRIENEKRAAAWEEAEKSKHLARYKREEIKIQAWESQQKAKLDAEIQRVEAQVEQLRAQAHAKMVKKIEMARQKSEEKRAAAEARRNREAERTAAQVEFIRQTGRIPSSNFICCGWF